MLGWRDTPVEVDAIGRVARASQPYIEQFFVGRPAGMSADAFERRLFIVRKRVEGWSRMRPTCATRASSTFPRSLLAPSSTRGCCWLIRSANFIANCSIPLTKSASMLSAPALLDEYLSYLAARAPVPVYVSQRRDQHSARKRELDERAAVDDVLAAVRGNEASCFR